MMKRRNTKRSIREVMLLALGSVMVAFSFAILSVVVGIKGNDPLWLYAVTVLFLSIAVFARKRAILLGRERRKRKEELEKDRVMKRVDLFLSAFIAGNLEAATDILRAIKTEPHRSVLTGLLAGADYRSRSKSRKEAAGLRIDQIRNFLSHTNR